MLYYYDGMIVPAGKSADGKESALESNANTSAASRTPMSALSRAVCCAVFLICSASLPTLWSAPGAADQAAKFATGLSVALLVICAVYALWQCRKPLFLIGLAVCTLFMASLGLSFGALTAALICGICAGGALFSDIKKQHLWLFGLSVPAAYLIALLLTRDPLGALACLLPLCGAVALAICLRKQYSLIVTTGALTGVLIVALITLLLCANAAGGMPLTPDGLRTLIDTYRTVLADGFRQTFDLMMETPEMAEQLTAIFGESLSAEQLDEIAASYGAMALNMLPGLVGMLLWCVAFVTAKGSIAALLQKTPRESYPAHTTVFSPSLPTAVFYMLCLIGCAITVFFAQLEIVFFICLNILMILSPMMTVTGVLDIVASFKRPHFRFGSIALYVVAAIFLGVGILPLIAVTGAFSVITRTVIKALEKKLNSNKGEQ